MYNGQQEIIASSQPKTPAVRVSVGCVLALLGTAAAGFAASRKTEPAFWPEGMVLIVSGLLILTGIFLLCHAASISKSEIILYVGGVRGRAIQETGPAFEKGRYVDFDIAIENVQQVAWHQNVVTIKSHEKSLRTLCETEEAAREIALLARRQLREERHIMK